MEIIFIGLILSVMFYAAIDLLRYAWQVRNWRREGAWEKYVF